MASDRPGDAAKVSPASSDTGSQAKPKLKRQRVTREGPPQLQFLVATNPSQFRDEDAKRSVRSQAMIHWRHEENKKKRRGSVEVGSIPSPPASHTTRGRPVRSEYVASSPIRTRRPRSSQSSAPSCPSDTEQEQQGYAYSITNSDPLDLSPSSSHSFDAGSLSWQLTAIENASCFPQYQTQIQTITDESVTNYEESKEHEERQLRTLIYGLATFHSVSGSHDPFDVMPQFQNPQLNSLYLSRTCMRAFASDSTTKKWLPLMLSHPYIILSSNNLASTWLDMHDRCSGDSTTTALVKAETITMINERLANPVLQPDDTTLIIILHLFAGEMWVCDEEVLRIHENGIATFIIRRGGLPSFAHNKAMAEVAVACCQHCDIFCESEVLPPFRERVPTSFAPFESKTAVPESPLFCPRYNYFTIANDAYCSSSALELLCDMRDLTNLFLKHNAALNATYDVDAMDIEHLHPIPDDYEARVLEIQMRMASRPSAHTPGVLVSGDWIYEACRITALIYTAAIVMGVPFSVAADPNCVDLFDTPTYFSRRDSCAGSHRTPLTEALHETLQRTDTNNLWKNMSGALYWVSAVGAAAARTPSTMNMAQQKKPGADAYSVWVRRCLIMTATRTMIVLVFEHPTAIITAQRTLLKVQDLIGTYSPSHRRI
ncbi:hypothetical protein ST47_g3671 [Ascochyta rabiei]|uniref:Uncharacterized protein n=1 Tax=Didymella rabiei TaxID=5454 RepID=A0A163H5P0_DIDRA|nr:hypothetical protein ST47_g3671 [Ascochyta rabiei]